MKKIITLVLAFTLMMSLAACTSNENKDTLYTAGTYNGEAQGNNAIVKVEVVLTQDAISEINIIEHAETAGISDVPLVQIPKSIIENQTLNVDTVSSATVTSNAIIEAVTEALKSANVDVTTLQTKAESNDLVALEDKEYDVVIVGAGGAGLSAAVEAANNGASVLLVEKMAYAGGNTLLSYAELACPNNWIQEDKGIIDSPELMAKEMFEGGGSLAKKELVDIVAENSLEAALWLKDDIGVVYQDYLVHEGGHSVARAVEPVELGAGMIIPLVDAAVEAGVEIMYNTKGDELIVDESGKVVGIEVSNGDQSATMSAKNGVILTTGGFGANIEMREEYNTRWETLDESVKTTNSPAIVGEGIIMAENIGANLLGMEHIQLYPFNNPVTGVFYGIEAPSWSGEGLIYVNQDGNRFVNELGMRDERAEGILAQNGPVYAIYNQEVADRLGLEENFADEYAKCLEDGVFYKADTLEEVAEFFEINGENLVATMDKYNESMSNNLDTEFGRTTSMVTMEKGPWFILEGVVSVHHTMGGVEINENAEVINTDEAIIENLYAAGEVVGGIHGNNRVGTCAISEIAVFGRIAGENAALNN